MPVQIPSFFFFLGVATIALSSWTNAQSDDLAKWDLEQVIDAHETTLVQLHSFDCTFLETSRNGHTTQSSWIKRGGQEKFERKAEFSTSDPNHKHLICYEVYYVDADRNLERRVFLPDYNDLKRIHPGEQFGGVAIEAPLGRNHLGFMPWCLGSAGTGILRELA